MRICPSIIIVGRTHRERERVIVGVEGSVDRIEITGTQGDRVEEEEDPDLNPIIIILQVIVGSGRATSHLICRGADLIKDPVIRVAEVSRLI